MKKLTIIFVTLSLSCTKQVSELDKPVHLDQDVSFLQAEEVLLAEPRVDVDSFLFRKSALLSMYFGLEDTKILYSINEGDKKVYESAIKINESSKVKIQAINKSYMSSSIKVINLVKVTDKLKEAKITMNPSPSESYPGNGAASLLDLKKGSYNFRDGNQWLGFQARQVDIDMEVEKAIEISKVQVSFLRDHSAWIFSPAKFKVYVDDKLLLTKTNEIPPSADEGALQTMEPLILEQTVTGTKLRIELESLEVIPEWHPGAGTAPWLFVDEIIVE